MTLLFWKKRNIAYSTIFLESINGFAKTRRFDIIFAIASLSQFLAFPRTNHLVIAKRILGYLKMYLKSGFEINLGKLI